MKNNETGKTYAIADLHGRYDLLSSALKEIYQREPGKIVFLGDFVDRGPDSRKVIEKLMAGGEEGWEFVCIQGNHDLMMADACRRQTPMDIQSWLDNGGVETLYSYGAHTGQGIYEAMELVPKEHIDWIRSLPLWHETEHNVFVHGAVDEDSDLEKTPTGTLHWACYGQRPLPDGYRGKVVVHGHEGDERNPTIYGKRVALDTYAHATDRLAVAVFDQDNGFPVEFIEVKKG